MADIIKNTLTDSVPGNNLSKEKAGTFDASVTLANANIEKGNWDVAYSYLKTAVEINPNYAEGHNHLGVYYTRNKKYTEAINSFKKALQIDFVFVDAHYNLANVYLERKEYAMALSHFKEVVRVLPDDHEAYYLMGVCCINDNNEKDAEAFFHESNRLKADYAPAAINLCKILIKKQDYAMAKNTLFFLLKKDASQPEVNFLLGLIYKMQQKYSKAVHHFREVVLKDKDNAEAYNLLGECCLEMELDKQAESFFIMALKLDMSYINPFVNLGNLYYKQKRYTDAIPYLEEYLKTKEASDSINAIWSDMPVKNTEEIAPLYNLLGYCYKQTNNPVSARVMWEKSMSVLPNQQEIQGELALLPQPTRIHKK
ncbi:MAG: tetratricopeptide repeat protein, partial [Planctomycetota bacterium]